ncbi:MAG: DUF2183 domain-containing protein [Verrucomicrobiales bacterium]|nr:DUF2183 domain-containing protein [Verrucomicrobiales bacterium]
MPKPSKSIAKFVALKIEFVYRKLHRLIAWLTGYLGHPMTCDIYYAVEHEDGVSIKGRVMRVRTIRDPDPNDSALRNLLEMWKNWVTPERPNTEVVITFGDEERVVRSDQYGYFEAEFPILPSDKTISLHIPVSDSDPIEVSPVPYCPENAEFLLISDIDDTILVTDAARTLRMIATTLLGNALTRQIFPGTSALYRGLKRGTTDHGSPHKNPICYVTSSPFNLHNLVSLIFQTNDIPDGAFLMAFWGMDEHKWFRHAHRDHKLDEIRIALSWYPSLPVILIGDSGEHDTEIYAEVVRNNPKRIIDVLIRNVSSDSKIKQLRARWEELVEEDNFFIFNDSAEAAKHLFERGRITEDVVTEVEKSISDAGFLN